MEQAEFDAEANAALIAKYSGRIQQYENGPDKQDEIAVLQQRLANAMQTISYWAGRAHQEQQARATAEFQLGLARAKVCELSFRPPIAAAEDKPDEQADQKRVDTIIDDLNKGRVGPKQTDAIGVAVDRAKSDQAVARAMRNAWRL